METKFTVIKTTAFCGETTTTRNVFDDEVSIVKRLLLEMNSPFKTKEELISELEEIKQAIQSDIKFISLTEVA